MSSTSITEELILREKLKAAKTERYAHTDYWTIPQAALVLNQPEKLIRKAVRSHDIPVVYPDGTHTPKMLAAAARGWAKDNLPAEPGIPYGFQE
ncbi:hypothetical protein [Bifidobacterium bombi]|uniref:Uncharacterized protein n=1 Tax=Bifidobacterium bombi DSM 19703 TaxID=1341695 RepID=A0A080N3F5_9BIFI|nr:hypothetical protein [Bifidobacterium bombi]KFF31677.1 hypothetical protein BBOMB_1064 [Bifidobacterium bombi DSM 19703]